MTSTTKVPFLPGYSARNSEADDFRKCHSLDYQNGYPLKRKPMIGIGGQPIVHNILEEQNLQELIGRENLDKAAIRYDPRNVQQPSAPFIPAHVAFDKLVLSFNAYFKQTIHDSVEQYVLRKVRIFVYLEDDSIAVVEPPQENSGIPQGVLIKRQRLPKNETEYYTPSTEISIYGKTFRITSCDKFTEKYMSDQLNITLNAPEEMPVDPHVVLRQKRSTNKLPKTSNDKLKKFLENDRKVLRFYCSWDDRESMYGELRHFILNYFLVDDSIEVREEKGHNRGRDSFNILLRRQQLPKKYEGLDVHFLTPKYTWRDLSIGVSVNVLGRQMQIYDCDKYTRDYYKDNLGYSDRDLQPLYRNTENEKHVPSREIPPYNGYGTLEDSLGSCKYLVLKPPKKDFIKMLENEKKVLRFVAVLDSKYREDASRQFVISFRLADDTMTIYEPPQRNAGFFGGKFLERTRALKPGHTLQNPQYYEATDLFVGAHLEINHHKFVLIDADEYVFNYMEQNVHKFPQSNINLIIPKLKASISNIQELLTKADSSNAGYLTRSAFIASLSNASPAINKHDLIVIAREFDLNDDNKIDYKKIVEIVNQI